MAVYPVLDTNKINNILRCYNLGQLQHFEAVASGIENTNYFLWLKSNDKQVTQWVLTIFENLCESSLPFYNNLTIDLSQKGFAVPAPQPMINGQYVFSINGSDQTQTRKFGVLVPKFEGRSMSAPNEAECQKIAVFAANMHNALSDFSDTRNIQHSVAWAERLVKELSLVIPKSELLFIESALERYRGFQVYIDQCPSGIVHGDLFRDNVLFEGEEISGVIDFYNAGKTALLFDLAVIANDWAVNFECLPSLFSSNQSDIENIDLHAIYSQQKLNAIVAAYDRTFGTARKSRHTNRDQSSDPTMDRRARPLNCRSWVLYRHGRTIDASCPAYPKHLR